MSASGTGRAIAAVAILMVTIGACGHPADTAAPPSTAAATTSATAPVPSTAPSPAPSSPRSPATTPRTSPSPAPVLTCATAALRLSLGQGDSGAGHHYVPIRFTNTGAPCSISGYPGVSYYAGNDRHQVGDAAVREPGAVPRLVLHRGESAWAWVDQINIDVYDPAPCGPTPVTGLRVYPPGNTVPVLLPEPGARACANHMPDQRPLGVHAVQHDTEIH